MNEAEMDGDREGRWGRRCPVLDWSVREWTSAVSRQRQAALGNKALRGWGADCMNCSWICASFSEDRVLNFVQDLRFALRQMRRSPGFVVTAVLTLALGVGANTAVYSLLDQALLRSLPVAKPEQLVVLSAPGKEWEGHSSDHGAGEEKS